MYISVVIPLCCYFLGFPSGGLNEIKNFQAESIPKSTTEDGGISQDLYKTEMYSFI